MTEPMSTPDSGGLREAVESVLFDMKRRTGGSGGGYEGAVRRSVCRPYIIELEDALGAHLAPKPLGDFMDLYPAVAAAAPVMGGNCARGVHVDCLIGDCGCGCHVEQKSNDYRKGYIDGEIDGSRHVIKEVYSAIKHLHPPHVDMGVAEIVTWALGRAAHPEPVPTPDSPKVTLLGSPRSGHVVDDSPCWCGELHVPASEGVTYEQGYREGASSAHADWFTALDHLLPDDIDPDQVTPSHVASLLTPFSATPDSADDATVGEREACGNCDCQMGCEGFATPPADDANRAPMSGGLDEGEREALSVGYYDAATETDALALVERILAARAKAAETERDTARREAGERIALAMADEFADRVEWEDGKQYIAVADAQRIARNEPNL